MMTDIPHFFKQLTTGLAAYELCRCSTYTNLLSWRR